MPHNIMDLDEDIRTNLVKDLILSKFGSMKKFSDVSGIPTTTLSSTFSRGISGMPVGRWLKICKLLEVDAETFEPLEEKKPTITYELTLEEPEDKILKTFKQLTPENKEKLQDFGNLLIESQMFRSR